jgi:hypothetical protein
MKTYPSLSSFSDHDEISRTLSGGADGGAARIYKARVEVSAEGLVGRGILGIFLPDKICWLVFPHGCSDIFLRGGPSIEDLSVNLIRL